MFFHGENEDPKPAKDEISEYVNLLRTLKNIKLKTGLEYIDDKFFSPLGRLVYEPKLLTGLEGLESGI
jgi:hypothetical protein